MGLRKVIIKTGCIIISAIMLFGCSQTNGDKENQTNGNNDMNQNTEKIIHDYTIIINPDIKYQKIEGFGASGAWWAQTVGGWDNAEEIMDLLYSLEKGIGLNIYRYNIGAGKPSRAAYTSRICDTLEVSPGVYDIERDRNAINIFKMAVERGATENVAFINSPPARMTVSGQTSGGLTAKVSNLKPEFEQDFATYCADIVELLIAEGLPVRYISPINEPQWDWGGDWVGQEGCHYEPEQVVRVGSAVASELEKRGMETKVSLAESGAWYDERYTLTMYKMLMDDPVLSKHMDHYAVHSYWTDTTNRKKSALYFSKIPDMLPLHMTEWCQMEHGRDFDMKGAFPLVKEMHSDLTIMNVSSWSHWVAVASGDYQDGLIYIDEPSHKYRAAKRMWGFGNYSRFIKNGYSRIDATGGNSELLVSAYQSPESNETVIVVINESENAVKSGFTGLTGSSTEVYITDDERDCLNLSETVSDVSEYDIPPRSVVTFINK